MDKSLLYSTPIGLLKIVANSEGICAVKWLSGKNSNQSEKDSQEDENADSVPKAQEHLKACQRWLDAYFDGSLLTENSTLSKPPLVLPDKSPFFQTVWDTLLSSGVGETLTYKELAQRSGKSTAARAAGNAVKSHCLPILVPCHRVVKSTGRRAAAKRNSTCAPYEIGQYSGGEGTETKKWLLEHERAMLKKVSN